jgi:hypothetical protein
MCYIMLHQIHLFLTGINSFRPDHTLAKHA